MQGATSITASLEKQGFRRVFPAKVAGVQVVARGVKKITFQMEERLPFTAWQYVWVELINMKIDDSRGSRRAFSILNTINDENTIDIVARISESGYKQDLFALEVGDPVRIHGPFGNSFMIDEQHSDRNIIMIAGGIGIAAFLPMLYTVRDKSFPVKCFLVYLNNSEETTPFLKELEELKNSASWFDYRVSYKKFSFDDAASAWPSFGERVRWWIAGPQGMVNWVYEELENGGISRVDMEFEESYPIPKRNLAMANIEKHLVTDNIFVDAIQNSTNHTIITDANGTILFVNNAAEQMTGYSREEIIGNTPRLWGGVMSCEFYEEFWLLKASKKPFKNLIINRRKNGELYYALAHIAPILDEKSEVAGFIGTEEDVTSIKEQEAKTKESEQQLKLALEGNRDGLWDWNVVTDEVYFSPRWKEMLGYREDEIQNNVQEWEKRVHPDDLNNVKKILNEHLEGKSPFYESEHRVLCKDGSYKWILDRGKVIERDSSGKATRATGTHTDISERIAARKALEALTQKFRLATQSAKMGVWEWNVADNSLVWDEQMYALYGTARGRFGETYEAWRETVYPDDVEVAEQTIRQALSGEKELDMTYRVIWQDQSIHYLRAFGYVERDEAGKPAKMFGLNFDVTHEMELEQERNDFISLASHQLRTPLTGIRWVVERFVKTETLSAKGKEYMNDIHASAERLSALVENLLNASRVRSGGIEVKPEDLEVVAYLEKLFKEYGPLCEERKVKLIFGDHPGAMNMKTDHNAFKNIIQSLIDNAVSYTPEGGTVEVSVGQDGPTCKIKVSDTGIGIPKSEQGKIFEKFTRASNAKLYKAGGTGIGLYIASRATGLLGGKIRFESEENKGTTFFVELPVIATEVKGEKSLL